MLRKFLCIMGLLGGVSSTAAHAQTTAGYGDWQLHLPTARPVRLADAGNRLYVVAENAFYFLDKNQNTTQVLSSRDGLHDVGAALVAYDSVKRQTVVVYKNSNIDVLQSNGSVRNVSDVLRKTVQGNRTVYDLTVAGRKAYLSTSFGLIVIDLDKLEISDTYASIGAGGGDVVVYAAAVLHDSLFVATAQGAQVGRLRDNLLDYRSWARLGGIGAGSCRHLATHADHLYAGVNFDGVRIFQRATSAFVPVNGGYANNITQLRSTPAGLLVASDANGVERVENRSSGRYPQLVAPAATNDRVMDFVRASDGSYYVANLETDLQRVPPGSGSARETYKANGPQTALAYGILADARSNTVDVFSGGYSTGYVSAGLRQGFYEYKDGQWTNFTSQNYSAADFPNLTDEVRGTRAADGTLYIATFKDGLLRWNGKGNFTQFTVGNGSGAPFKLRDMVPGYVQVTDIAIAPDGKVWVANYHKQQGKPGLFAYDPDAKTWAAPYDTVNFITSGFERLAIDNVGQVWAAGARKGGQQSEVLDPATEQHTPFDTNTGSTEIYDIIKDRLGAIWVATGKGVAVLSDPGSAFLSGGATFRTPIVRRGEGTGFPALFSDVVKCLAVDGGNRKWFGTDNGLWLFSADADEALLHFTTANSPLPSNHIQDVDVNNKTGEVWVATDAGVVSYRGSASDTDGSPDCTKVFPNPVRPDFAGTMGITGVVNNAKVKITDVAGHLVYATTASGGTVTWNLNDVSGQRVRSGVYLVLTSDADGANTCVSKVAVLSK